MMKHSIEKRIAPGATPQQAIRQLAAFERGGSTFDLAGVSILTRILDRAAEIDPACRTRLPSEMLNYLNQADSLKLHGSAVRQFFALCGDDITAAVTLLRGQEFNHPSPFWVQSQMLVFSEKTKPEPLAWLVFKNSVEHIQHFVPGFGQERPAPTHPGGPRGHADPV